MPQKNLAAPAQPPFIYAVFKSYCHNTLARRLAGLAGMDSEKITRYYTRTYFLIAGLTIGPIGSSWCPP
jgi:hypothetical protein